MVLLHVCVEATMLLGVSFLAFGLGPKSPESDCGCGMCSSREVTTTGAFSL